MTTKIIENIAIIHAEELLITDAQSVLDLTASEKTRSHSYGRIFE